MSSTDQQSSIHSQQRVRRGLWAVGLFMLGLAIGRECGPGVTLVWLGLSLGAAIVAACIKGRVAFWSLGCAAIFLGAGWFGVRVLHRPSDAMDRLLAAAPEDSVVLVRGVVLENPREEPVATPIRGRSNTSATLNVRAREVLLGSTWTATTGVVRVRIWGGVPSVHDTPIRAGSSIELVGRWKPTIELQNPGQRNAAHWRAQDGMVGSVWIERHEAVTTLEHVSWWDTATEWPRRWIGSLRSRTAGALDRALGPEATGDQHGDQARALLRAMLIGQEEPELRPVSESLARLGIVHMLSISGFHLVLGAMVIIWLVRLTGDRGWLEPMIAGVGVVLYVLVIPPEAPVVRSAAMIVGLLICEALGRRYDRLNVLGWIALGVLLWRPMDAWSAGFQLSFGVTGALIWRGAVWQQWLLTCGLFGMPGVEGRVRPLRDVFDGFKRAVAGLLSTAGLAWVVSTPIVLWHTGMVALLGMIGGVVVTVPAMAALVAGFLALIAGVFGSVGTWVARVFGEGAEWLARLVVIMGDELGALPGVSARLPQVSVAWCLCATVVSLMLIAPGGWQKRSVQIAGIIVALWLGVTIWQARTVNVDACIDGLALTDSRVTLVRSGNEAVLIDPGSASVRSGARTIQRAILGCGGWRVPTIVLTSPRAERLNHTLELLEPLGTHVVYLTPEVRAVAEGKPDSPAGLVLQGLARRGIEIREWRVEGVTIGTGAIWLDGSTPRVFGARWTVEISDEPVTNATRVEIANDAATVSIWDADGWQPQVRGER